MTDDEAYAYINNLSSAEQPEPEDEAAFLREHGFDSDEFLNVYGFHAASLAQSWYESNGWRGISLGAAIKAANTGLLLASYRFVKLHDSASLSFKSCAKPFIADELERLINAEN